MRLLRLLLLAPLVMLAGTSLAASGHGAKKKPHAPSTPPPPEGSVTPEAEKLGRGVRALWSGELATARHNLAPLVASGTKLHNVDYALYALAQAELLDGNAEAALAHFAKVAAMKSRFSTVAAARQADAARELGKRDVARHLYETALAHPSADVDAAALRYRLAELAEPGDDAADAAKARAAAAYHKIYVEHPLHPLAERALERMKALDPTMTISAADRIARAKTMTANRGWPLALEELKLLPNDLPQAQRDEADYWYGTTLFRMRREYDVAAEKLLSVWQRLGSDDRKSEALFHGARAKSRADLDDDAIAGYREVVAKFPHAKSAAEASFLIGWLDFNRGRYTDAVPSLRETLKRYGSSQFADDALWYLGFSLWLAGQTDDALVEFTRLAKLHGNLAGGKGAYWRAMALAKLGRADEAHQELVALAKARPFTYYSLVARARILEKGDDPGPFDDGPEKHVVKPGPTLAHVLDATVTADPAVRRVDELLAAGLGVEASFELQRAEGELLRRYTAERALPVLFDRYSRGQDFFRIHRLAEGHAGRALDLDPYEEHDGVTSRPWWELVYPRAYRSFVEKYAPTGKNPTYYLYTIMQKESAYNPHDVSYADAIGLLQMIPPTSRKVAEHVGVAYTDDVLYDPEGNIRFGAWYIGHLLQKFKGQIAIGAGSYNAGPKAMMKWLDKNGTRQLDEFIELCPYTQTREYMKKALAIYSRYVYLYDHKDYLPSLKIDADYVKDDGVDY